MSNEQKEPQSRKPQTGSIGVWIAIGAAQSPKGKDK
jgi:hypothetical protein